MSIKVNTNNLAWFKNQSGVGRKANQNIIDSLILRGSLELDTPDGVKIEDVPEEERPEHPGQSHFEYEAQYSSSILGPRYTVKKDAVDAEAVRQQNGQVKYGMKAGNRRYRHALPIVNAIRVAAGLDRISQISINVTPYSGESKTETENVLHNNLKVLGSQNVDYQGNLPEALKLVLEGAAETEVIKGLGVSKGTGEKLHKISLLHIKFPDLDVIPGIVSGQYTWNKLNKGDIFALLGKPDAKTGKVSAEVATEETVAQYLGSPEANPITIKMDRNKFLRAAEASPSKHVKQFLTWAANMEMDKIAESQATPERVEILDSALAALSETY